MLKKKGRNKGFTLVELLVVIAIIGILAVVAVPSLFKNIYKAKWSELEADYSAVKSAVLSYYADNSELPKGNIEIKDSPIKNYIEGMKEKPSVGGKYMIADEIDESLEYIVGLDEKGELKNFKVGKVNEKFSAFLILDADNYGDFPQITKEQFIKLNKDIGLGRVFADSDENPGKDFTFDDGLAVMYFGLIEK